MWAPYTVRVSDKAPQNPYTIRPGNPDAADHHGELREIETALSKRWPENKIEPSLDRMRALMDILGQPQRAYPAIHITGTNGKTSTARMIEQLLNTFELRTGRYTSPHVESVTERISLDGAPISVDKFIETYRDIEPYVEMVDQQQPIAMSFFEVLTGMAYAAFADAPIDVAVVEVGMGGTWDATNVIDAAVSVITPIGLDHTDRLGNTTGEIGTQKAGIIKTGGLAVVSQQPLDAAEAILRRAVEVDATVAREGMEFGVIRREVAVGGQMVTIRGIGGAEYEDIFIPLHGAYQAHNAALALCAVEAFFGVGGKSGGDRLDIDKVRQGFSGVSSPGRLEVIRRSPTVILDAAHNPHGAQASVEAIRESFGFSKLVGVIATSGDKDASGFLEAFEPILAEVVITENSTHRATPVDQLAAIAVEIFGEDRVRVEPRLDDAIEAAITAAEEEDLGGAGVIVTGSVITIGEARILLGRK